VVSQYGGGQTETGKVFVAPSTETFAHDADGNLTSDGRWTYSWDGENRLVQMIRDSDSPTGARQKMVFEYDHQGRRVRKQFHTYNNGWQEQTDTVFLYDGWNLVAELNANSSNARVRTYVWGTDLSGSMQGAGGVGGLLKLTYYGTSTTNAFVAYDGNGNVTALIDAANGNVCARYEYGPFAEPIRSSGPLSKLNPIRFSTKYTDNESSFLYYGYRYYNPSTGRWLSHDRVEQSSQSLYSFLGDDPVGNWEYLGLFALKFAETSPKWLLKREGFWAGITFKFDKADRGAIGSSVTVVARHNAYVQVTPCSTSGQTRKASSSRWFATQLNLGPDGNIRNRRSGMENYGAWGFELGWWGYHSEEAYRWMGGKTKRPTSGFYQTDVELIIFPGKIDLPPSASSLSTDWLHPENKSHQGWTMVDDYPDGISTQPHKFTFTLLSFFWDNCCGREIWDFSYFSDPGIGRGGPAIYNQHKYDGEVCLLDRPTNP